MKQKHRTVKPSHLPVESEMSERTYYYASRLLLTIEEMDEEDEEGINLEDFHNALLLNLAEVEKRIWEREGKLN